jgi:hypothetical protein
MQRRLPRSKSWWEFDFIPVRSFSSIGELTRADERYVDLEGAVVMRARDESIS